jgi:hypothetical protein
MKAKKTAAFWGVHQAVWQEHSDISEEVAVPFIYCDDGARKSLLTSGSLFYLTTVICHFCRYACQQSASWQHQYGKWADRKWQIIVVRYNNEPISDYISSHPRRQWSIELWHHVVWYMVVIKLSEEPATRIFKVQNGGSMFNWTVCNYLEARTIW